MSRLFDLARLETGFSNNFHEILSVCGNCAELRSRQEHPELINKIKRLIKGDAAICAAGGILARFPNYFCQPR